MPSRFFYKHTLNEQGDVVEILSVGNDTTQRRQAEEALQGSEAKFRAIFENSQVGIFRNRLSDGLILNANQRLANLLGFDSPGEIIGLEHGIDYFINPSDRLTIRSQPGQGTEIIVTVNP